MLSKNFKIWPPLYLTSISLLFSSGVSISGTVTATVHENLCLLLVGIKAYLLAFMCRTWRNLSACINFYLCAREWTFWLSVVLPTVNGLNCHCLIGPPSFQKLYVHVGNSERDECRRPHSFCPALAFTPMHLAGTRHPAHPGPRSQGGQAGRPLHQAV